MIKTGIPRTNMFRMLKKWCKIKLYHLALFCVLVLLIIAVLKRPKSTEEIIITSVKRHADGKLDGTKTIARNANDMPGTGSSAGYRFQRLPITTARQIQGVKETEQFDDRFPLSVRDNPYEIINKDVCKNVKDLKFVVLVHSSTTNFMRRSSIRETWANYKIFKKYSVRIVFVLGKPEMASTQVLIEHENSLHNDIIQGKFLDTYHNLTHKGVLGIRWVSEYCYESRMVAKVDDDVFVNVFKLMDGVINKYSKGSRTIYCKAREKGTSFIERHKGKWKIGDSYFKNLTHFPMPHCNGFFVLFQANMAGELFRAAKKTPFLWLDDVYVYGILPDKIGNVTFIRLPNLSIDENESIQCFESSNKPCTLLVGNAHSKGVMEKFWFKTIEQYKDLVKVYSSNELIER